MFDEKGVAQLATNRELEEFERTHPYPDRAGLKSLYRFMSATKLERLESLFLHRKLYHSLPCELNDPFECKPHFRWPTKPEDVRIIRQGFVRACRRNGHSRKTAEALVSKSMQNTDFMRNAIHDAMRQAFSDVRICSFTSSIKNLLFWAHYADSHRGLCVEFDATVLPFSAAFKVNYDDAYPEASYPQPHDARGFKPILIKSKVWEYEDEYRTVFVPEARDNLRNDGISIILSGREITNVYFGANMDPKVRELILDLLSRGPFDPVLWQAKPSESEFSLQFEPLK